MALEKNKLFVGNLDGRVRRYHLKEFFGQYGEVAYTKVIYDRETRRSRGFGFVLFDKEADATRALEEANGKVIELAGEEFSERDMRLMYAEAREEKVPEEDEELEKNGEDVDEPSITEESQEKTEDEVSPEGTVDLAL